MYAKLVDATKQQEVESFSQAGDLISKKRNRLSPETIQKVICLNNWLENSFLKDKNK
jgi:hypothetical protein